MNNTGPDTSKQGVADAVVREPQVFVDPDFVNGEVKLSRAEVAFFKEQGFLVKRGFLDEPEAFARIVDYVWENVPRGLFKRDDPQSWLHIPHDEWTEEDQKKSGMLTRGGWKMRSSGGIGTEPFFVDKIANHPRMRKLVALFIGEPVKYANRVRGVYCTFPKPPGSEGRLGPHADGTAAQISAMVFVDEVPPNCGGFTVWPGSHCLMHPLWNTVQGSVRNPDCADEYTRIRDAAVKDITPVEFAGAVGDVVFWHPRLIHSPGINCSAELGRPVVRLIVPCDYQRADRTFYDDLDGGPGPNHQWWVDTRNHREDIPTTEDNIWHGWVF